MGSQNWKQIVEALAGTPPKPIVYRFNGGRDAQTTPTVRSGGHKRKLPQGYFEENKIHGAYKDTVVDGEIV